MLLPIASIDEPQVDLRAHDPRQLKRLATSIGKVGVVVPISVRPHPEILDRWILNSGVMRLRASKLAGETQIPAVVGQELDPLQSFEEHRHRERLRPFELAGAVGKCVAAGHSQTEVALRLGTSQPYISFLMALAHPSEWLLSIYRDGKCRGIKELYELRRLHDKKPAVVETWVAAKSYVSRSVLAELRELCLAQHRTPLHEGVSPVVPGDTPP